MHARCRKNEVVVVYTRSDVESWRAEIERRVLNVPLDGFSLKNVRIVIFIVTRY